MARSVWTFDHPSDIGLEASADSPGELMAALAEGLAGEICDRSLVRAAGERTLAVSVESRTASGGGVDYESLAVDLLTVVMNEVQVRHFMVREAVVEIAPSRAVVRLSGERYAPSRHEIKVEIKAVTYHQLTIERGDEKWFGRVILDI